MRLEIWSETQDTLIRYEDREPECGEDFCDSCGDCLHCYAGDYCSDGCRWIIYVDDVEYFDSTYAAYISGLRSV